VYFCTNCGVQLNSITSICPYCCLDPKIPEEIIDNDLKCFSFEKKEKALCSKIEYQGESASLAFSILMMILIAIIFASLTLGIFVIYIIFGLILHRIREAQTRAKFVRASENNFHEIYKLSKIGAYRLKIPLPPVYIKADPSLNAYTSGFWGDHWIVLHSALLKKFNFEELLYVIGHEMGHIKREHVTWLHLMAPAGVRPIPLISDGLKLIFNNWSIKAEYSADRAGLIANKNLKSCVSALSMIVTGHRNIKIESLLEEYERLQKNPLSHMSELFRTHPYYPNGIKQLYQ